MLDPFPGGGLSMLDPCPGGGLSMPFPGKDLRAFFSGGLPKEVTKTQTSGMWRPLRVVSAALQQATKGEP